MSKIVSKAIKIHDKTEFPRKREGVQGLSVEVVCRGTKGIGEDPFIAWYDFNQNVWTVEGKRYVYYDFEWAYTDFFN